MLKIPVSLRVEQDFYDTYLKNIRKERELSDLAVTLLKLYFSNTVVREELIKFKFQDADHSAINSVIKILDDVQEGQVKIKSMCNDVTFTVENALSLQNKVDVLENKFNKVIGLLEGGAITPKANLTVEESPLKQDIEVAKVVTVTENKPVITVEKEESVESVKMFEEVPKIQPVTKVEPVSTGLMSEIEPPKPAKRSPKGLAKLMGSVN